MGNTSLPECIHRAERRVPIFERYGGSRVSREAVTILTELEETIRRRRADAAAAAKNAVAAAQAAGEQAVLDAEEKANAEISALRKQTEDAAKEAAKTKAAQLENRKAVLKARAGAQSDKAIALIVERIVND